MESGRRCISMDNILEAVERSILMSGVDDWVDVSEAVDYARHAMDGPAVTELEALPTAAMAIKHLIQQGYVEVGTVTETFTPWAGEVEELTARIDSAVKSAAFPLEFGDLFWISNTPAGDELGRQLLDAGQAPIGSEPGIGGR